MCELVSFFVLSIRTLLVHSKVFDIVYLTNILHFYNFFYKEFLNMYLQVHLQQLSLDLNLVDLIYAHIEFKVLNYPYLHLRSLY